MVKCCDNIGCKHFGEPYVDLGYGYPVCLSQPAQLYPKPIGEQYKGYKKWYKVIKTVG